MAFAILKVMVLGALLGTFCVPQQAMAQTRSRPCGCYCDKWLPAPCSDNACKQACGWQAPSTGSSPVPGSSGPSIDYEAERRAKEEAERQREEAERREQERLKAERQKQFERERDAAAKGLKGGGNSASFGLKGMDPASTGLRAPGERVERDLAGRQAAWKQLHCAASILGPALAALTPPAGKEPDFAESRYLLGEAQNALSGQKLGVQCAAAPALPQISGRAPDMDRALENQQRLIRRAGAAVDQLEQARRPRSPDEERIARVYAKQKANEEVHDRKIEPVREQQRQINREREKKPVQPAVQEAQAKREIENIAADNKKAEEGNFTSVSVNTKDVDKAAPPTRNKKSAVEPQ